METAVSGPSTSSGWPMVDGDGPSVTTALRAALLGALVLAFVVLLVLLRQGGFRSWETVWAEDGGIYFQQANDHGGLAVLLRGYAGYLQLPSRLLGALSTAVPIRDLAVYFAVAGSTVSALLAWFTWWASAGWVTWRPMRLALAALVVLMPALGFENTANITNTIWTFTMVAPWALVSLRERPAGVVVRSVVAFIAAAASAINVLFLPVALAWVLWRRTRASAIVAGAFIGGLVLQGLVVINTTDEATLLPAVRESARLAKLISVRVFAEHALGNRTITALWSDHSHLLMVVPLLVVLSLLAVLARHARDRRRLILASGFFVLAVLAFALPVWGRGTNAVVMTDGDARAVFPIAGRPVGDPDRIYLPNQLRYSVVPVLLLSSTIGILVSALPETTKRRRFGGPVRALFVAHVVVLVIVGFSVRNGRSAGPAWRASLDVTYANQCAALEGDARVKVVTNRFGTFFPVELRCRELER